jgi:Calcineurin-like phosphoesterase
MNDSLVRRLFDGPVDIVGDTHGEIEAVRNLLSHLGYREGIHPEGRRLVFVGDLTDRGPDSLAVLHLVQKLVDAERAQCVLGNHDFNILHGAEKYDNNWFFGKEFRHDGKLVPQKLVPDKETRNRICDFFRTLPLVLERDELRVIHACWQTEMVDLARQATDVMELYLRHVRLIEEANAAKPNLDEVDRALEQQNRNPVKLLTSGPEKRIAAPVFQSGKLRHEERVPWWTQYEGSAFCVFGHYGILPGKPHRNGQTFCSDYGVGKRWTERLQPGFDGRFQARLGALRFPEMMVVFDDGTMEEN